MNYTTFYFCPFCKNELINKPYRDSYHIDRVVRRCPTCKCGISSENMIKEKFNHNTTYFKGLFKTSK